MCDIYIDMHITNKNTGCIYENIYFSMCCFDRDIIYIDKGDYFYNSNEKSYIDPHWNENSYFLERSYTLNDITKFELHCDENDILRDIFYQLFFENEFSSLHEITIPKYFLSDYFINYLMYNQNIDILTIYHDPLFIITKKFIDMLLYKKFFLFSMTGNNGEYRLPNPKIIIKRILNEKQNYIISDDVLSYMKNVVYEYYDIFFF